MLDYRQVISHNSFKDFVPYAFYYGNDAILTKNGELIKVIKIVSSVNAGGLANPRPLILDFLSNYIENDISVWLTTIRSKDKNNFDYRTFDESSNINISLQFDKKWKEFNKINHFENEFYISIILNDRIDLVSLKNVVPLISGFDKGSYSAKLNSLYKKLTTKVDKFCSLLVDFSPYVLSIKEYSGEYFSELEMFFSRIIKSSNGLKLLDKSDISSSLINNRSIEFLDNDIHLEGDIYGAVFTAKYHCELSSNIIFDILNCQFDLVVTEVIFSDDIKMKKDKNYSLSLDKFSYFITASRDKNLDDYFKSMNNDQTFLKQTSFMIFGKKDDINLLAFKFNEKCSKYGIVVYRENVGVEEAFFSQLPGNFHYLMRLKPVSLKALCNFNNSVEMKTEWHNSLCFNDYHRYGEFFFLDQRSKNINFIFGENKDFERFILMLNINFSRFDSLIVVSCFDREYGVISGADNSDDGCFLNVLTNSERNEINSIMEGGMSLIFGNNDSVSELVSVILNYFTSQKILFNLQSLLKKLSDDGLFGEIFDNLKYDNNFKMKFIDIKHFHGDDYLNILSLILIVFSIQKLILKEDIVVILDDAKILDDPVFSDRFDGLFAFILKNNLHLFICYSGTDLHLSKMTLPAENVLYFIIPNNFQTSLYKELNFKDENIEYFDSLLKKNTKFLIVKSDNRILFSSFDLEKFSLENSSFFVKK